ncbi:S8 family serine peptidase [Maricaulaceae bacterium MS644]
MLKTLIKEGLSRRELLIAAAALSAGGCEVDEELLEGFQAANPSGGFAPELAGVAGESWLETALSGRGVRIGVIDAGFGGFDSNPFTRGLQVEETRSFVPIESDTFFGDPDDHGVSVTQYIGGRSDDRVRGLAPEAAYLLAKGEDQQSERRSDELGVMNALDWLAAHDVKLINIALGYTRFEDAEPYSPDSMDGRTAEVTRRVTAMLEADPALIIVASAGNQGRSDWRVVTAPGDAEHAITVGSAQHGGAARRPTSGVGNPQADFIKPDFVISSGRGASSVATGVVTGLVACLRQAFPDASRDQIRAALRFAGSNRAAPNREIGYGVPDGARALAHLSEHVEPRPAGSQ